jgi:methionyl-tRNA formyltransferase
MKIVFFGTSEFSAGILDSLRVLDHKIEAIVTRPDRPQGRNLQLKGSPVKEYALEFLPGIPVLQPEKASTEEFAALLKEFGADLFLVVAYGEILKQNILSIPSACVNIHTSLLPKYRGAAPIQRCLMHGDPISGVTFMEMALKMDAGDILKQVIVEVDPQMGKETLERALLEASKQALPEFLENFSLYYANKRPQEESEVTIAAKITPLDCAPDWSKTAKEIHDQIRALSPFPGVFIKIRFGEEVKRLKILASRVEAGSVEKEGVLLVTPQSIKISCKKDFLVLEVVQMEGKKALKVEDFLRGVSKHFSLAG